MVDYDEDKVDELVLAMLYLTLSESDEHGGRAWKGLNWDALDRLHKKELISDPKSKAKSVYLDKDGLDKARAMFFKHCGKKK